MGKWRKILTLSDPYPTPWYEISCYLKTILGTIFLVFGIFFLFYSALLEIKLGPFMTGVTPVGQKIFAFFSRILGTIPLWNVILGIALILLGIYLFLKIKLVRDLGKIWKSYKK